MAISKGQKAIVRYWVPPVLRDLFNRLSGNAIVFDGQYASWDEAARAAGGYDEGSLFERVEAAALAVRDGKAAWEQDGVLHAQIPPDFPQLACLSQAALAAGGKLSVLDFGGGFGSSYHQARRYLDPSVELQWHIVEQPRVVESGRRQLQGDALQFHDSIEACMAVAKPQLALLCGLLQYLPEPRALLAQLAALPIPFLLIDRHPKSSGGEVISVQRLPDSLYPASYPCWLFDLEQLDRELSRDFEKVACWDGKDPPIRGRGIGASYVGQFWRKRAQG